LLDVLFELFPNSPRPAFAPARAGDIYKSLGSPAYTKETIGFKAQTSLADGLKETVNWMG
jgi:nucleoside-diphosphate-sugar epimerase